jgi:hypothetical protein
MIQEIYHNPGMLWELWQSMGSVDDLAANDKLLEQQEVVIASTVAQAESSIKPALIKLVNGTAGAKFTAWLDRKIGEFAHQCFGMFLNIHEPLLSLYDL